MNFNPTWSYETVLRGKLSAQIDMGCPVEISTVSAESFCVIDHEGVEHDWTIHLFQSLDKSDEADRIWKITASAPANTLGNFRLRLKKGVILYKTEANSVDHQSGPQAAVDSKERMVLSFDDLEGIGTQPTCPDCPGPTPPEEEPPDRIVAEWSRLNWNNVRNRITATVTFKDADTCDPVTVFKPTTSSFGASRYGAGDGRTSAISVSGGWTSRSRDPKVRGKTVGTNFIVTVTPVSNYANRYWIVVRKNTIYPISLDWESGPETNTRSSSVWVDNRPPTVSVTPSSSDYAEKTRVTISTTYARARRYLLQPLATTDSARENARWLTVNSSGVLSGETPSIYGATGRFSFTYFLTVWNAAGLARATYFTIWVKNTKKPVIASISTQSVDEGEILSFTVGVREFFNANEAINDPEGWQLEGNDWLQLQKISSILLKNTYVKLVGTAPQVTENQTYNYSLTAYNNAGRSEPATFYVSVNVTDKPEITLGGGDTRCSKENTPFTDIGVTINNFSGTPTLTLDSPSGATNWLEYYATSKVIRAKQDSRGRRRTPNVNGGRSEYVTYKFKLSARNSYGTTDKYFYIYVYNTSAPSLSEITPNPSIVNEGTAAGTTGSVNFYVGGSEVKEWSMIYVGAYVSTTNNPSGTLSVWSTARIKDWLQINSSAGQITQKRTAPFVSGQTGIITYTYKVTGFNFNYGKKQSISDTFNIGVANVNAPRIGWVNYTSTLDQGATVSVTFGGGDVQTWTLTASSSNPSGTEWLILVDAKANPGRASGTAPPVTSGTVNYSYTLKAHNNTTTASTAPSETINFTIRSTKGSINSLTIPKLNEESSVTSYRLTGQAISRWISPLTLNSRSSTTSYTGPTWRLTVNTRTGYLEGATPQINYGEITYNFTAKADDLAGTSPQPSTSFSITVKNTTAIRLTSISNRSIEEVTSILAIDVNANPNSAVESWTFTKSGGTGNVDWLKFNKSTYQITGNSPWLWGTGTLTYEYTLTASNNVTSSTSTTFTITVTQGNYVVTWSNPNYCETNHKLSATVRFSHTVSYFSQYDFEVIDSSNDVQSWTKNVPQRNSRNLSLSTTTPASTDIIISADVPDGVYGDYALRIKKDSIRFNGATGSNGPSAASAFTPKVLVDRRPAVGVCSHTSPNSSRTRPLRGASSLFTLVLTYSVPKTEVTKNDFTTTAGTVSSVIGGGTGTESNTYIIVVDHPVGTTTSYTLKFLKNSISGNSTSTPYYGPGPITDTTFAAVYIKTTYVIDWINEPTNVVNELTATLRIQGTTATGIELADFDIINTVPCEQPIIGKAGHTTGWTLTVPHSNTTSSRNNINITARPPAQTEGQFRIRLNANRINVLRGTDNAPSSAIISDLISVSNRAIATVSWGTVSIINDSANIPEKLQSALTFSGASITGLDTSDFEVVKKATVNRVVTYTVQNNWSFRITNSSGNSVYSSTTFSAGSTATVTATAPDNADGDFGIRIKARSINSDGGNNNAPAVAQTSGFKAFDNRPQLAIAGFSAQTSTGNDRITAEKSNFLLTFNYSVPTSEVTKSDFTPSAGSIADEDDIVGRTTTNAIQYNIYVTNPTGGRGSYSLTINANSVPASTSGTIYKAGPLTGDTRRTSSLVYYDTREAVDQCSFSAPPSSTSSPVRSDTSTFGLTLTYTIPATELTRSDFTSGGGTIVSVSPSPVGATSTNTFNIVVNNPRGQVKVGSYQISLLRNSIPGITTGSPLYKTGPPSHRSSPRVYYDTRRVTAAWSNISYNISHTGKLSGTLTFSGPTGITVSGISTADFRVTNNASPPVEQGSWTFDSVSASTTVGAGIVVKAAPPTGTEGQFKLRLRADSVNSQGGTNNAPADDEDTPPIEVNNRRIATAAWSGVLYCETSQKLEGTLTFSSPNSLSLTVADISTADFEAIAADNCDQAWTFDAVSTSVNTGTRGVNLAIKAAVPDNTTGTFRLKLKRRSVRSDGGTTNNAPAADVISSGVAIEIRPVVTVDSFIPPSAITSSNPVTSKEVTLTLTFSKAINATELCSSEFTFVNTSAASVQEVTRVTRSSNYYSRSFKIKVRNPSNSSGYYQVRLNENSIPTTTTYRQGPPRSPEADRTSARVYFNTTIRPERPTWGSVSAPTTERAVSSTLTFPSALNPGALVIDNTTDSQVRMQKRTGTAAPYTWNTESNINWGISVVTPISNANKSESVTAIPAPSVEEGFYRFTLIAESYGTGSVAVPSAAFEIGEDMANPSVTIGRAEFLRATTESPPRPDRIIFYLYWSNAIESQLDNLTDSNIGDRSTIYHNNEEVIDNSFTISIISETGRTRDGSTFPIRVTGFSANTTGTISVVIEANALNGASASDIVTSAAVGSEVIAYDTTSVVPMVSIDAGTFYPSNNTIKFTITWENVTSTQLNEFTKEDITVNGTTGTDRSALYASGPNTRVVTISNLPTNTTGNLSITIGADALGTGTNTSLQSACVNYDTRTPTTTTTAVARPSITIDNGYFCPTSNKIFWNVFVSNLGTATFANLNANDLTINVESGKQADVVSTTIINVGTNTLTVEVAIDSNKSGNASLTIRANALSSNAATIPADATPTNSSVTSSCIFYDTRALGKKPFANFILPNGIQNSTTSNIIINFSERVTGLSSTDITITGHSIGPDKKVLCNDWEITLNTADRNLDPANLTIRNLTPNPDIYSVIPSPIDTDNTKWILQLSPAVESLSTSNITGRTLNGSPRSIGQYYTLQITNPTGESGTLGATLTEDGVTSLINNVEGPVTNQNSGTYAYDTRGTVTFTIQDVYANVSESNWRTTTNPRPQATDEEPKLNVNSSDEDIPITAGTVYVQITSGETSVSGSVLSASDFIITGACDSNTLGAEFTETINSATHYFRRLTVVIPEGEKGIFTVALLDNVVPQGNEAVSKSFKYDRTTAQTRLTIPPTAVFGIPSGIQGDTSNIKINFSEYITGLNEADLIVSGASTTPTNRLLYHNFELTLNPGNTGLCPNNLSIVGITSNPIILGLTPSPGVTDGTKWILLLDKGIGVLLLSNIQSSPGTTINITSITKTKGSTYTLRITNPTNSSGTLSVTLKANSVTTADDSTLGPEVALSSGSYAYDTRPPGAIPPSATFILPSGLQTTSIGTPAGTSDIQVNFGERVIGLAATDFDVSGIVGSNPTWEFLQTDFEVTLTTARTTAPTFTSSLGTITSITVNRSSRGPQSGETDRWILTIDPAHSSFTKSNLTSTALLKSGTDLVPIGYFYRLKITNPTNAAGAIQATLAQNSVRSADTDTEGPKTPETSGSYPYDTRAVPDTGPSVSFTLPSGVQRDATSDIGVCFGQRVMLKTGLTGNLIDQFTLTGPTNASTLNKELLCTDFEITLLVAIDQATMDRASLTVTGLAADTINSRVPSPLDLDQDSNPATFTKWILTLNESVSATTNTGLSSNPFGGLAISGNAIPMSPNYILRITNPTDSEGTINATLTANTVSTASNTPVDGPSSPQSSGSYSYNTTSTGLFPNPTFEVPDTLQELDQESRIIVNFTERIKELVTNDFEIDVERTSTTGATSIPDEDRELLYYDFEIEYTGVNPRFTVTSGAIPIDANKYCVFESPNAEIIGSPGENRKSKWIVHLFEPLSEIGVSSPSGIGSDKINSDIGYRYALAITNPDAGAGKIRITLKKDSAKTSEGNALGPETPQVSDAYEYGTPAAIPFAGRWWYASYDRERDEIRASIQFNYQIKNLDTRFSSADAQNPIKTNNDIRIVGGLDSLDTALDTNRNEDYWVYTSFTSDPPDPAALTNPGTETSTLSSGSYLIVKIKPPSDTDDLVYLVFDQLDILFGSNPAIPRDTPVRDRTTISEPIEVNNRVVQTGLQVRWLYATYSAEENRIWAAIQFNQTVRGLDLRTSIGNQTGDNSDFKLEIMNSTGGWAGLPNATNAPDWNFATEEDNPSTQPFSTQPPDPGTLEQPTGDTTKQNYILKNGAQLHMVIQPPEGIDQVVRLVFKKADEDDSNPGVSYGSGSSSGPNCDIPSEPIPVDNVPPVVGLIGCWSGVRWDISERKLKGSISFNQDIRGLSLGTNAPQNSANTDIKIADITLTELQGWTLAFPGQDDGNLTKGTALNVEAEPPNEFFTSGSRHNVRFVFKKADNAVADQGVSFGPPPEQGSTESEPKGPGCDIESDPVPVEINHPYAVVVSGVGTETIKTTQHIIGLETHLDTGQVATDGLTIDDFVIIGAKGTLSSGADDS